MAEPKTPWLYPYREDPQQTRLGQPVFRPFVPVSLATEGASTPELEGLIDTGADPILASDLLADELGLDLADNEGEELPAVGGRTVSPATRPSPCAYTTATIPALGASGKPRWDLQNGSSPQALLQTTTGLVMK